ncbi:hypothetical protein CULT_70002 [[Clostridium] ultunense Esp]|nr:hypothetical protein CULT_70002 [[Clostridium] ultunense Esp]
MGSSPSTATILTEALTHFICQVTFYGSVAQSVEQRTENPRVGGSIPSRATIKTTDFILSDILFLMSGFIGIRRGSEVAKRGRL